MAKFKPKSKKSKRIALVVGFIGTASAVITIIGYFTGTLPDFFRSGNSTEKAIVNYTTNNTTNNNNNPPSANSEITPPTPRAFQSTIVNKQLHHSVRTFLGIKITGIGEQWNNNLAGKLASIFSGKGYNTKEMGPGATDDFDNLVSVNLVLNGPEEMKVPFNASTMEYSLVLTLLFHNGRSTQPCAERIFHQTVSTEKTDTRDGILTQGIIGLVDQVKNEPSFPFCIEKQTAALITKQ